MNIRKFLLVIFLPLACLILIQPPQWLFAAGTNYYVDSVSGSDGNSGTSSGSPWKTLTKVQGHTFSPGDTMNFKRGSSWTGALFINNSGSSGNPITFRDYGTDTLPPTISNPSTGPGHYVISVQASWVIVENLLVKDSGDAGIYIQSGAKYNTIQNNEATNTGFGVYTDGPFNLITNNNAHDLHMTNNTVGGDDDYGAVGFVIANSNNEVSYNRCVNCRAPSYDYGYDGGVVELWANGDYSNIHHNYGTGSEGFIEIGGGSAKHVRIAYNVSAGNYGDFACLHNAGTFGDVIDDFQIDNNTIIANLSTGSTVLNCMDAAVTPSQLLFQNNIVVSTFSVFTQSSFTHSNNIYSLSGGATVGYPLGTGEQLTDPKLTTVNGCPFHLQASSPAIAAGVNLSPLGYLVDYHGNPLPSKPAIGSHEYVGSPSPTPTPRPPTGPGTLFLPYASP